MRDVFKYIVYIICVASLGAVKFRCDYQYVTGLGWFKYHAIPASWSDARLRCRFEGAMLVSPYTDAIKHVMMNKMSSCEMFTGIHATVSPGSYYSIDGIPLDEFSYRWADKEPDNKDDAERCISFNCKGYLSDVRCDKPHPYMCYRPESKGKKKGANICGTTDPEYYYETRTDKCYKFHGVARQYKRAHFVCSAEGGHLVIINSDKEAQVIRELFAKYPPHKVFGHFGKDYAFIGFHNYGESQDWITVDGQTLTEAGFDQFALGEPNNVTAGEYCGAVHRSGFFDDLWCERHFAFICEKDTDHPKVCDSRDYNQYVGQSDADSQLSEISDVAQTISQTTPHKPDVNVTKLPGAV